MLSSTFTTWVLSLDTRERTLSEVKPMSITARFHAVGHTVKRAETLLEFFAARSSK